MNKKSSRELASNRKAFHEYEILETFEAGLALVGTEIKSLRNHECSIREAFVKISGGEAYLLQSSIAPYKYGNIHNHVEKRDRKLLLNKAELKKLHIAVQEKGLTIVPLSIFLSSKGFAKIKIAIARGKKLHDKRASSKEREEKRNIQRILKNQD